ncbi:ATP-binding protein [Staphylococcus coagulans]|uniref:ATP-binding protein n=1 Tax=Staphylococcus coagulans TaxID=74706 RepID=UPI001F4C37CF|nr:ATP-binding protein [Staphylococcus coagulans]UNB48949.1 ATP-binding protein [Staphylococcus coagulans]
MKSTIITTNIPFSSWGDSFSNKIASAPIIDRLIHHSKIFKITGGSYRLKDYKSEKSLNIRHSQTAKKRHFQTAIDNGLGKQAKRGRTLFFCLRILDIDPHLTIQNDLYNIDVRGEKCFLCYCTMLIRYSISNAPPTTNIIKKELNVFTFKPINLFFFILKAHFKLI